jgi:molybdate transport system permease protein
LDDLLVTLLLTFKLATLTTAILFIVSVPIGYFLAYSNSRINPVISSLVSLPLVLPPSVIGFYLLMAFSPNFFFGQFLDEYLNFSLAFSFEGILLGSLIYGLPFMINPIVAGFQNLPDNLKEASHSLGKGRIETLFRVLLPNIKPTLISASVVTFAHTLGEFGVVLMIGGSIPGETKVASVAIFHEVEAIHYDVANKYSIILFTISFLILLSVYFLNKKEYKAF